MPLGLSKPLCDTTTPKRTNTSSTKALLAASSGVHNKIRLIDNAFTFDYLKVDDRRRNQRNNNREASADYSPQLSGFDAKESVGVSWSVNVPNAKIRDKLLRFQQTR